MLSWYTNLWKIQDLLHNSIDHFKRTDSSSPHSADNKQSKQTKISFNQENNNQACMLNEATIQKETITNNNDIENNKNDQSICNIQPVAQDKKVVINKLRAAIFAAASLESDKTSGGNNKIIGLGKNCNGPALQQTANVNLSGQVANSLLMSFSHWNYEDIINF